MKSRITISSRYPRYWEYDGKPILLLGGSREDNLFQLPDIEEQLDLLASVGGNYIRCTMSSRDEGDVWPFELVDGAYDLNKPSAEYWARLERCLRLCYDRDIIAQIEVWDRFDFSRGPWESNPFNPKNTRSYTAEEIGMAEEYPLHPGANVQPFFYSVPAEQNNTRLLAFQQQFVDWLMAHTLPFPNVLYCMDNETSGSPEWGAYWAMAIKRAAAEKGVVAHTTEMWDAWDVRSEEHQATIGHPETYSFIDLSQNNQTQGQANWDNMQAVMASIAQQPRPINNVKIYGGPAKVHKDEIHGQQSFWRAAFGGVAAVRFHRPATGLGLGPLAQKHIRSMRMVEESFSDFFAAAPHNDLLNDRTENGCYCRALPGKELAVVFFDGNSVTVDLTGFDSAKTLRWLDIGKAAWGETATVEPGRQTLQPPSGGFWVAMVTS